METLVWTRGRSFPLSRLESRYCVSRGASNSARWNAAFDPPAIGRGCWPYPDFPSDVTAEDLRLRFFGPMREVSHELLDKLIHYDPACAMAFIAVDEQSQRMLGVVRLHDDTSGETAEFAILVRSPLKEHGVGWLLMKHMIEFSKHKNLKIVQGQVLSENTTMLAMCAELGFHIADDPDDPGVKTVTLPVRTAHLDANFG